MAEVIVSGKNKASEMLRPDLPDHLNSGQERPEWNQAERKAKLTAKQRQRTFALDAGVVRIRHLPLVNYDPPEEPAFLEDAEGFGEINPAIATTEVLGHAAVAQGAVRVARGTWEAVRRNVQEAVRAYYFDQPEPPKRIRLHLVRDEVLAGG